ncbi:MAG: RNA polymerase-binding protein RbpA [Propionibacteriaceae bacterium]|nr:RNA polymerase-binding protein RbpA [Propionibacteriaceae bacterium]
MNNNDFAPRIEITFNCTSGHEFTKTFAADVSVPPTWECPHCGQFGAQCTQTITPMSAPSRKTHWDMILERRDMDELSVMLLERVDELHRPN